MEQRQARTTIAQLDPSRWGVSFSLKQCRDFQVSPGECLDFLINQLGFRRFRLMSYWDEHEKSPGNYDFATLDQQVKQIEDAGGVITLCVGARQPRWPESHWPNWALQLGQAEKYQALYAYLEVVLNRYKEHPSIISWQLENEALNRSFGKNGDFNRLRLRTELEIIRQLDPKRPVIMSTSNTWGLPLRRPQPDQFGFTFYRVQYHKSRYRRSKMPTWWYPVRAKLIRLYSGKPSFIHELQAEPWGPKAIWEMSTYEQNKSMDQTQLTENLQLAIKTGLHPIDLWGGEWWYWRYKQGDQEIAQTVRDLITTV